MHKGLAKLFISIIYGLFYWEHDTLIFRSLIHE